MIKLFESNQIKPIQTMELNRMELIDLVRFDLIIVSIT